MELKDFAKESALAMKAMSMGKNLWGALSGSTVKKIEQGIAGHAGDMSTGAQRRLARYGEMLPKAKAFQRNARIGAGLAAGGLVAGRLSKRDSE